MDKGWEQFNYSVSQLQSSLNPIIAADTSSDDRKFASQMWDSQRQFYWDQLKANKELNEYFMQKQMDYNDTQLQRTMEDAKLAGLNPYMVIGNPNSGSVTAPNNGVSGLTPNSVSYSKAPQFSDNSALLNGVSNMKTQAVERQLMKSSYEKQIAEVADIKELTKGKSIDNLYKERMYLNQLLNDKYSRAKSDSERNKIDVERYQLEESFELRMNNILSETNKNVAHADNLQKQGNVFDEDASLKRIQSKSLELGLPFISSEAKSRIKKNYMEAGMYYSKARLDDALKTTEIKTRESKIEKMANDAAISAAERFIKEVQAGTNGSLTNEQRNQIIQLYVDEVKAKVDYAKANAILKDRQATMAYWTEVTNGIGAIGSALLGIGSLKAKGAKGVSKPTPVPKPIDYGQPPQPMH